MTTGGDDPDRRVELLWRAREHEPRPGLSLARIVRAAVELADAEGLDGLSMRKVADRLGFTTMSLYRHVPGRDQLVELMRDHVLGEHPTVRTAREEARTTQTADRTIEEEALATPTPDRTTEEEARTTPTTDLTEQTAGKPATETWRDRLATAVHQAWQIRKRHPWLAEIRGTRHLPGPNAVAHYDYLLSTLTDTALKPSEVIAAVGLVGRFVDAEALTLVETQREERRSGVSEQEWWGARDSLYAHLDRYPTLSSLWRSGGWHHPEDSFEFGLRRLLDGIEALIQERDEKRDEICQECGRPLDPTPTGRPRVYCSRACRQRAYRRRTR
ncbi:TetR/AcrR family transcriptional regulator [Nonomuraea sp. B12E4]|uniref:TetR/AcrR family transcriptional regulator n=1 Tax=Nonomuraea sp. B12E4 TaxID=3153564 RepID=UPI00325F78BB